MTDLSRVEELLLELVTQQERLIGRVERLEGVMTDLHQNRENDITGAIGMALGDEIRTMGINTAAIGREMSLYDRDSFASRLLHELQGHEEPTFAHSLLTKLDSIDDSLKALRR